MPLKINGTTIPNFTIIPAIMGLVWFGGLSYQVNANDTEIEELSKTPIQLAALEANVKNQEKALDELKDEVKDAAKEQALALAEILRAVKEK